jgi:hypothetical protein
MAGRGLLYAQGHATVAGWVNTRLAVGITAASQIAKLIKQLPGVPLVARALADGEVSEQQAFVIAKAVATFTGSVKTEAQEVLIAQAPVLKPEELAVAGRRVLRLVDPEAARQHELKQLEREEKRGCEDRGFTLSPDGTGRVRISGRTDAEARRSSGLLWTRSVTLPAALRKCLMRPMSHCCCHCKTTARQANADMMR